MWRNSDAAELPLSWYSPEEFGAADSAVKIERLEYVAPRSLILQAVLLNLLMLSMFEIDRYIYI